MTKVKLTGKNETVVFRNAACILTFDFDASGVFDSTSTLVLGQKKQEDLVIVDGVIEAIGKNCAEKYKNSAHYTEIDATHLTVMPGLVDAHTHPIFGGSRAQETVMKSQGMSYEEIAARGGGIVSSMKATRESSNAELTEAYIQNAKTALERGVVLLEAKTGYGLSPEHELRMLECMYAAYRGDAVLPNIAPTLLGPHAASPEHHGLDSYIQALIDFLPQFSAMNIAQERGFGLPLAVDAFIERNYFTAEQGERWLAASLQHGLDVHIHADEFSRSGGAEVAALLAKSREQSQFSRDKKGRVLSIDHCQYATESDLGKLCSLGVAAVALPATSFFSNIAFVEAPRFRASGIRVAIASDFNPGSAPMNNLWFSAYLALTRCGFSLSEVLLGVTRNAAFALGAENDFGVLALGRKGRVVAFRGKSPEEFFSSPIGDHVEHVVMVR